MHLNPTLFSGAELEESGPIPWQGGQPVLLALGWGRSLLIWDGKSLGIKHQEDFKGDSSPPGSEEQLGMSPALCPGSPQDVQH